MDPAQPGAGALVRLFHVSKSYLAGSWALRDVTVELDKGEFVFLTGPSGAGKTTLMKLIFAAEQPSEGQIIVLGRNVGRLGPSGVPALRRRIGAGKHNGLPGPAQQGIRPGCCAVASQFDRPQIFAAQQ